MARPLRLWAACTLLLAAQFAGFGAQAQDTAGYPARPVKIIVPFAPAGPTDTMARLIAQKLSDSLGKQFYIENHPGAGGNLGMAMVANAAPDGYTLLLVSSSVVVNPSLYEKVPYDVYKSLAPVTLAGSSPNILVVHPSVPAKNVKELIAYVQANPGKVSFASPGFGTTASLAAESFKYALKLDIQPVPFNGAGPALNAVVAGQVQIGFMALPPVTPHLKAGTLRALAMTTEKRVAAAPDVPTMAEAGVPGDQISDVMQAVFAPGGTPKPIIDLLQKEIAKAVAAPDVKAKLEFPRLRCDRRHAGAFRSAYQDGSAEVGKGDRGGQDRKSEIKRLRGEELMKVAARLVAIAAAVLAAGAVQAASYPDHPVKIVVPFAPAGPTDVMARLIAQKLSESLKQQFYVENHPGAGGNIGMVQVAKSAPDGYTILVASSSFVVNPSLYAKNPYDPFKDFAPVTLAAASPNILVVNADFPAKTVKELVDLVKKNPGKYNYAMPGTGTTPHLAGELFKLTFKLDLATVPFNGAGPAIQSAVAGHTPIAFTALPPTAPQVQAGKLRGLAVTSTKRSSALARRADHGRKQA